ncbi:MAG: helix-turn-helix domain-containing protein [bacterium]
MLNLLSLDEARKELKISIHTMRAWTHQGKFPIVKLGRRVLIRREDLEIFVNKSVVEGRGV